MVAQFLRLKLKLLANIFRRSPLQVVGILIGLVYGVGAAIVSVLGLVSLRLVDPIVAGSVTVTVGSTLVVGFLLVPLAFGADDSLDPRAFSLFGIPAPRLAAGIALAGLLGLPALLIIAIAIAQVVTWARDPLSVVLAILGAVLIVVTCLLGARVSSSIATSLLATRRSREVTGLISLITIVSLAPIAAWLSTVDWDRDGLSALASVAGTLGWTPLGAAWAAPASAASGHPAVAIVQLLIAAASAGALWLAWRALVGWMLVTPERRERGTASAGLGWFARMPNTPSGVIAARSVTYWMRDARYRTSIIAIPIAPLIFVLALSVAGVPWHVLALVPVPVMCLLLSWSIHNDVAYDSSAVWLHVASNTPGSADRFGRVVPALMIGVPLVLIGSPICAALYGESSALPSLIGASSSLLLAGLGVSSVVSARFPYPAVRPGDSPFAQPQASGTGAGLIQSLSFLAAFALSSPPIVFAVLGVLQGGLWPLGALLAGIGLGMAFLALGIVWGGRIFNRRAPELLAFTLKH